MKTVNFLCSVFCSFLNTVAAWLDLLAIKVFNCLYSVLSLFLYVVAAIVSPVGNTGCPLPGLCPLFVSSVTVARAAGSKNCRLMRSVLCSFLHTVATWLGLLAIKASNCRCSIFCSFFFFHTVTVARAAGSKNCRLMRSGPLFLSSHCCCMARPVGNEAAVSSLCSVPF